MALPTCDELIQTLQNLASPDNVAGMRRFGIRGEKMLGISIYTLRPLAKDIRSHPLALELWQTGIHDARLLACFVDLPAEVTRPQMDAWAADFDSWDLCDQACTSLFDLTPHAFPAALEWPQREEEFVRRAAFALMAGLAVHAKKTPDQEFLPFFPLMVQYSCDGRNFVKKAVNWALRNLGKRSPFLMEHALRTAEEIHHIDCPSARWIASDALRELRKRAK